MLAFEIAAAMVALALTPQQSAPRQDRDQHHETASRSGTASRAASERNVQSKRRGTICGKGLKGYDARSKTYRDGRGKRQRCTR